MTQFRIINFGSNNHIAELITLQAAKSNGSCNHLTLGELAAVIKSEKLRYPSMCEGIEFTLINNKLLVDQTVGTKTNCILEIEEVELLELSYDHLLPQDGALAD